MMILPGCIGVPAWSVRGPREGPPCKGACSWVPSLAPILWRLCLLQQLLHFADGGRRVFAVHKLGTIQHPLQRGQGSLGGGKRFLFVAVLLVGEVLGEGRSFAAEG